jgi:siroheme synthase-like protein
VVDDPSLCGFIAPSIVRRGPVTLAVSTGGASPALARKLREELSADPVLEWADLAGVLSKARREVKKRHAVVDPERWQCCITQEVLRLVQAGQEQDALDLLLSGLLDGSTPALCPEVAQCHPSGCQVRPNKAMQGTSGGAGPGG